MDLKVKVKNCSLLVVIVATKQQVAAAAIVSCIFAFKKRSCAHIMLRDLLTQKCVQKMLVILDTPENVDSENIKIFK
jgi:hypothetical protein